MGGNRYDKEREYSSGVGSSYRRSRQEEGGSAGEVGRDFASRYGVCYFDKLYILNLLCIMSRKLS